MNEGEKIKHEILEQLKYGACCRKFCFEEPAVNRTEDNKFDTSFNELVDNGSIRKIRVKTMHVDGERIEMPSAKTVEKIGARAQRLQL